MWQKGSYLDSLFNKWWEEKMKERKVPIRFDTTFVVPTEEAMELIKEAFQFAYEYHRD